MNNNEVEEYWNSKLDKIVEISKEYGYDEQDKEFWSQKPCGIISLVIDIYEKKGK